MSDQKNIELPSGEEEIPLGSGIIKGLLGSGGMARVYKIWNPKLEMFRAVKLLSQSENLKHIERFETEVKITAKLEHPNIVKIFSVGEWKGLPYLEMEFVDGVSLDELIKKHGQIPQEVCCAIAWFIAKGLEYAHKQEVLLYGKTYQGIIHRDLKPANIMLSKSGIVKIMDFGIARPTETGIHTADLNIVGTLQYLSPEQIDGKEIDFRADIYALGAIVYEMLTGVKTFPQETITDLLMKKINNEYTNVNKFNAEISKEIGHVVRKCLFDDRNKRYGSSEELIGDIEKVLFTLCSESPDKILKEFSTNPGNIRKKPIGKPVKKKSNHLAIIAGSAVAVLIVGGAILIRYARSNNNNEIPLATREKAGSAKSYETIKAFTLDSTPASSKTEVIAEIKDTAKNAIVQNPPTPGRFVSEEETPGKKANVQKTTGSSEGAILARYKTDNLLSAARSAYKKEAYADVSRAIGKMKQTDKNAETAMMLLDSYIETGRLDEANKIVQADKIPDALFSLLSGKLLFKQGRIIKAIGMYQEAMTSASKLRDRAEIRRDALYLSAVAYGQLYLSDPSPANKATGVRSWQLVKDMYQDIPGNPRYGKAVKELEEMK